MDIVRNITLGDRAKVTSLLKIVDTILRIENGAKTSTCVLNIVIPSGTLIMFTSLGEDKDRVSHLGSEARAKAQELAADASNRLLLGKTPTSAEGVTFPNELIMTISGFGWAENKLAALWIGYEMGWIQLAEIRDIANEHPETVSKFMKLFRYFTAFADQAKVA